LSSLPRNVNLRHFSFIERLALRGPCGLRRLAQRA
jgi:hypothetical protein